MTISEPVSRDALLAAFLQLPPAVTANLRTIVAGVNYAARRYDSATLYNLIGAYNAGVGTVAGWPNLATGETVDQATASVWITNALLNYFADVGAVGATKGVQNLAIPNQIKHNGGATIWAGPSRSIGVITDVVIGDYVYLDNLIGGTLATVVIGFGYTSGNPNILILRDNLPSVLTGGAFFNVSISQVLPQVQLTTGQTTLTTTTVKANSAVTTTSTRVAVAKPIIAGAGTYSAVYTNYRAARPVPLLGQVTRYTSQEQVAAAFVGSQYPESGLGFAVARALAPAQVPVIVLPAVLAVAVASESTTDWQNVINRIQRRNDWYTLAPLTQNTAIQASIKTSIDARNLIGLNSRADFVQPLTTETIILSGAGNTVLVDQSLTTGFNQTVTRDGGVAAPFTGAIPGDIVQIAGVDYIIATWVSAQTVTITTPATAGALQVLNNVRHPLTPSEQADAYGAVAQAFGDQSISLIFPTAPSWADQVVDGSLLVAAIAGLRGYTAPQASDRGVLLEAGWTVPQSQYEFFPYLPLMADLGVYVIDAQEDVSGSIVLYANTTDQSETLTSREGLVANADAIRRYLQDQMSVLLGQVKITNSSLDQIRVTASTAVEYLRNNTSIPSFGAILVSGSVGQPVQNSARLDEVDVPIAITISASLETLVLDIVITIAGA